MEHTMRAQPGIDVEPDDVKSGVEVESTIETGSDERRLDVRSNSATVPGTLRDPEAIKNIVDRLRRIEGQARGIQRMLEEQRPCRDVIIQLTAMRNAVSKVAMMLIVENLEACILEGHGETVPREAIEEAKKLFMSL